MRKDLNALIVNKNLNPHEDYLRLSSPFSFTEEKEYTFFKTLTKIPENQRHEETASMV